MHVGRGIQRQRDTQVWNPREQGRTVKLEGMWTRTNLYGVAGEERAGEGVETHHAFSPKICLLRIQVGEWLRARRECLEHLLGEIAEILTQA